MSASLIDDPEVTHWQFLRALKSCRLLSADTIRMLDNYSSHEQEESLQEWLLEEGVLTPYQLRRIREGSGKGLVVGQYHILDQLGHGGGGAVYKARHSVMGRVVALKVLHPDFSREPTTAALFRREVAACARLSHQNIALTYDANEVDDTLFLALELIDGPTLERYVAEQGPLPVKLVCSIAIQTALALQHAHEMGIVHRDIKPANILLPGVVRPIVDPANPALVKVVDFGLARLLYSGESRPSTIMCPEGLTLGTPAFMAPEQIRSVHDADIRSDLYSLGCTIYYALTRRLPFDGSGTQATLLMHLNVEARPVRALRPDVPALLGGIVQRLLAKEPAERYQTPAELIAALNAFILSGGLAEDSAVIDTIPETPAPLASADTEEVPIVALTVRDTPDPAATARLHQQWGEWIAAVRDLSRKNGKTISDVEYRRLYRGLIESIKHCRDGADGSAECLLDRLQTHIEPWVNLDALVRLDDATKSGLVRTSMALDRHVRPGRNSSAPFQWGVPFVGLFLGLTGCLALWFWLR